MSKPIKAVRQARRASKKARKALKAAKRARAAWKTSAPGMTKAASATVVKAQRRADARGRRRCWNGCALINKARAKYCVGCGERLGISYAAHVDRTVRKARLGVLPAGRPRTRRSRSLPRAKATGPCGTPTSAKPTPG